MLATRRRSLTAAALALLTAFSFVVAAAELPKQLSDEEFWRMVTEFSEPGGYFRSDNFVSNETTFQYVIPALRQNLKPGGVYLGVGPDQNFTYIVALEPKISFIVDIRRQNMLLHLMYKALFELSDDRAEFLSRLFSRKQPEGLEKTASASELFRAFETVPADAALFAQNLKAVVGQLTGKHGFKLSSEDQRTIEYVYSAFHAGGPDLTYSGVYGRMPTYAQLMVQTDGQRNRSYMGSEENFQIMQTLQRKNLIVPLVGDFAGPKALRAIGQYLKDHGATVSVVYTSNVEQYLFQDPDNWKEYYSNVGTLPLDSSSTFIRSAFNMGGYYGGGGMSRSQQMLCSIAELLKAFTDGKISHYYDVINMSTAYSP